MEYKRIGEKPFKPGVQYVGLFDEKLLLGVSKWNCKTPEELERVLSVLNDRIKKKGIGCHHEN